MLVGFRNLEVYKRAYRLSILVHKVTQTLPSFEKFELGSQLRRAAVSIALNIAEGYGRKDSVKEFNYFIRNCIGSCNEVQVLLDIIKDIGYIPEHSHKELITEYEYLGRQLYRLRDSCSSKNKT